MPALRNAFKHKDKPMRCMKLLLLLALMPMLASCASDQTAHLTTTPPATGETKDPLCSHVQIVELSHADSDLTKEAVIKNNSVIEAVCGKNDIP